MKIEHFILSEGIEVAAGELTGTRMLPRDIRLLNPSPGTAATQLEFDAGIVTTGLPPGEPVSAVIEVCHDDVGVWVKLGELAETLGPTDTSWTIVHSIVFPPGREGTYKFRVTVKTSNESKREVRKLNVRFTPAN